jgi:hypothetical protein
VVRQLVEVEWLDSVSWSGWRPLAEATARATVEEQRHVSLGYLLLDNDAGLMIAQSLSDYPEEGSTMVGEVLMIPRAVVVSMRKLRSR